MNKSAPKLKLLAIIIISSLGVVVYSNTFFCSFHFDDEFSIIYNSAIRNLHDLQSIWSYLPRRFILYLSIALNYHFNKFNVFGYHLFNLMVHLIAAILVWWLTLLTFSTPAMKEEKIARHANSIALFAGLIFVTHPIQTEAVTYIVQRAASMATMFYLASLCFYIKSRLLFSNGRTQGPPLQQKFYYICSLIMAILAMFTKETTITLPLMILLYEFCFFVGADLVSARMDERADTRSAPTTHWKHLFPFLLTIFIIPVTMLLTETGAARLEQLRNEPSISSMHYLLTQFRVMVTYIRLAFLPLNQNLDYDYPIFKSISEFPVLISFLFLTSILFFATRLFSKYRFFSFSIFWFFLTLLPESSVLPIKDIIFEHRMYLPLVGYSMLLASGMYYFLGNESLKAIIFVLIGIIICYSVLTYQRNKVWRDDITLWSDAVSKSPYDGRAYVNLGIAYARKGNLDQSLIDLNKGIALDPKHLEAYLNRGVIYEKKGKLVAALIEYTKAIMLDPKFLMAYYNRAIIYKKLKDKSHCISDIKKIIEIGPYDPTAYYTWHEIVFKGQDNVDRVIPDLCKSGS